MLDDNNTKVKQNTEGGREVSERGEFVHLQFQIGWPGLYPSCEGDIFIEDLKEV